MWQEEGKIVLGHEAEEHEGGLRIKRALPLVHPRLDQVVRDADQIALVAGTNRQFVVAAKVGTHVAAALEDGQQGIEVMQVCGGHPGSALQVRGQQPFGGEELQLHGFQAPGIAIGRMELELIEKCLEEPAALGGGRTLAGKHGAGHLTHQGGPLDVHSQHLPLVGIQGIEDIPGGLCLAVQARMIANLQPSTSELPQSPAVVRAAA